MCWSFWPFLTTLHKMIPPSHVSIPRPLCLFCFPNIHHRLDGREFEWTPGVVDGQGGLACCDSWGRKESDMTEWLNWTEGDIRPVSFCNVSDEFSITRERKGARDWVRLADTEAVIECQKPEVSRALNRWSHKMEPKKDPSWSLWIKSRIRY